MKTVRRIAFWSLTVFVVVSVLASIAYLYYVEGKLPKVPVRASAELHQEHSISNDSVRLQLIGDMGWNGEP